MSVAADKPSSDSLRRTPLYDLHRALGARMVGFAGYEMPVQYPMGVLKEHLHTRAAAGLFDVSHMGQIVLRAKRGDVDEAARALERLVPMDVLGLAVGRQRYAFFTNEAGGILDDLMIARFPDSLLLICNAARKAADEAHLRDALSDCCEIEVLDSALIALQGPSAEAALAPLASNVSSMRFMEARETSIMGAKCIVTRSGYTGEDGFEISIPSSSAREIVETSARAAQCRADWARGARFIAAGSRPVPLWRRPRRGDDAGGGRSFLGHSKSPSARRLPRRGLSRRGRDSKPT